MPDVVIYSTMFCPFCHYAKRLLKDKGVEFQEIDVDMTAGARAEMTARSNGGRTVPQIFINDASIGGCDELYELEHAGKLDMLLRAA